MYDIYQIIKLHLTAVSSFGGSLIHNSYPVKSITVSPCSEYLKVIQNIHYIFATVIESLVAIFS